LQQHRFLRDEARLRAFVLSSYPFGVSRLFTQPCRFTEKDRSMAKAEARLKQAGIERPDASPSSSTTPLNFKVPLDFRREFKTYAAQHNKKMNQLLYEAFAALKARND
jgi:hypothetical protein